MPVEFALEYLTPQFTEEVAPLLEAHAAEIQAFGGRKPEPNWGAWMAMQEATRLVLVTARDDGKLVGYMAYLIEVNAQCIGLIQAVEQATYIDPKHRGGTGMKMMRLAEPTLKGLGATEIVAHVPLTHDHSPALERQGYKLAYKILIKEI